MDLEYIMWMEEATHKSVHSIHFHLHETLEQKKTHNLYWYKSDQQMTGEWELRGTNFKRAQLPKMM